MNTNSKQTTTTLTNTSQTINSQFKHTILWNNILANLKSQLIETNIQNTQNRLRKQHSRFVAASVGGMLLIKQNIIMNTTNTLNNLTSHGNSASNNNNNNTNNCSNSPLETIYFTGSQCIDIVYNYLIQNKESLQFERQITRDKCAKLCQMIMDSGVFESLNRSSTKFDDTSLKYYKFKSEYLKQFDDNNNNNNNVNSNQSTTTTNKSEVDKPTISELAKQIIKTDLCDQDDNYHKRNCDKENRSSSISNINRLTKNLDLNQCATDTNNNKNSVSSNNSSNLSASILFNKSKLMNKTNNVNTKLKRKLTAMRRSSTIHTLLPSTDTNQNDLPDNFINSSTKTGGLKVISFTPSSSSLTDSELNSTNTRKVNRTCSTSNECNLTNNSKVSTTTKATSKPKDHKPVKLDRTKSIDSASYDIKVKFENKSNTTNNLAQELLLTRQITRELILEKLLSLIDLPIIEHLLSIDEQNDLEYCEALQKFDNMLNCTNVSSSNVNIKKSISATDRLHDTDQIKIINNQSQSNQNQLNKLLSKINLNYVHNSLSCLTQTYDFSKYDIKEEWRKSALECLDFIDWEKLYHQQLKEKSNTSSLSSSSTSSSSTTSSISSVSSNHLNDKNLLLVLMKDTELYTLIKDYYVQKHKNNSHFLDDSFQPLFTHILIFIKKSHYNKAVEILNLGTLLLLKQTQAELKRLLKFLYLTANSSHAPRLCEEKPNNSIVLNHFAACLINSKLISFEESRLLLNFMLNNFDNLFRLSKSIEESINKRRQMARTGKEEALIEQIYCKRLSAKEYSDNTKEQTTKALVDLINHIIDDPQITLKQKKLKLKAMQRIHPEIYEKHFSDLF